MEELVESENAVVKAVQSETFANDIVFLKGISVEGSPSDRKVAKGYKTLLFSQIDRSEKIPVILPRKGHITDLIIRHFHERVNHQGRGMTINEIRA